MEEEKIYLNKQVRSAKDDLALDSLSGHDFGEQVSFTVGISYITASILGIARGTLEGFPKNFKQPPKLLMNNFFNAVGKRQSSFGQAAGSVALMYYFTGSTLNMLFEDEFYGVPDIQKNAICGMITGGIYKSTLGLVPFCVGSILGGAFFGSMTVLTSYLYKNNYINFEMKF